MSAALTIIVGRLGDCLSEVRGNCLPSARTRRLRRRRRITKDNSLCHYNADKHTTSDQHNTTSDQHSPSMKITNRQQSQNSSDSTNVNAANGNGLSIEKYALWKRLPVRAKKQTQLRGAKRLTESFRVRSNRIHVDSHTNEIVRFKDINKFSAWLGKNEKDIIAKLDENVELIKGMRTDNFAQYREVAKQRGDLEPEGSCLSVIFKDSVKTIDLIAPNTESRDKWFQILDQHIKRHKFARMEQNFNDFLMQEFHRADLNRNGRISFKELCAMLENLNIPFDKTEARNMFEAANFRTEEDSEEEALDLEEFIQFYNSLSVTKALDKEFKTLTNGGEFLELKDIQNLFIDVQKEAKGGLERICKEMIHKYEPLTKHINADSDSEHQRGILCSKGFRNMILGPEFDIWDQKKMGNVYQDMSRPLTDYYYSTSHNTYLEEDQLQSRSTTETYRLYLSTGCRSVEVDITDGDDYEPIVCHKNTLTTKLKLSDVIATIAQNAFLTSPYPVIISLENNCSKLESQRRAAQIIVEGLGNSLLAVPFKVGENQWPSPEALRGKIIIKGKSLPKAKPGESMEQLEERCGLAKELSDIVFYGISQKLAKIQPVEWKYNEMCSLEESVSLKFAGERVLYRKLTSDYMVKVYPFGLRFLSTNFDPVPHWHCGAQMVAMNFQTKDRKMLIYEAMFRNNGACGYVLKPDYCLHECLDLSKPKDQVWIQVQVTVLCALNLPTVNGIVNPYVIIKKYCPKKSQFERKFKTSVVYKNGLNPEWSQKFTFKFPKACSPLTFFRFKISNYSLLAKNTSIGGIIIPVDMMLQGYRNISLKDSHNRTIENAKLVVKVVKSEFTHHESFRFR